MTKQKPSTYPIQTRVTWQQVRLWPVHYPPHQSETVHAHCPFCDCRLSAVRRPGVGGGAARAAMVRGALWKHLQDEHPERIDVNVCGLCGQPHRRRNAGHGPKPRW